MITISKDSLLNKIFKFYGLLIYYKILRKTELFTLEEKKKFQFKKVKQSLLAAQDVPYYAKLFKEINFNPIKDFKSLEDLSKIPLLSKDSIKEDYKKFIKKSHNGIGIVYKTSGSTGSPMTVLLSPFMVAMDKAMIFRHHYWATKKLRPLIVSIRSYIPENENAPLFKYNKLENNYYFSAYNLSKENVRKYIEKIIDINPEVLRGYPSSVAFFSEFITKKDVENLTNLKAVITSSESLSFSERELIESKFGKVLLNWYGMTEPAVIIKENHENEGMNICFEYGYYELLDTAAPNIKKLVTTSFNNSVMPFIRYETGDLVEVDRSLDSAIIYDRIRNVIGRKDEYIIGESGNKIPSVNFYSLFREFKHLIGFQIIQYTTKEILVLIKSGRVILKEDKQKIYTEMIKRTGKLPIYVKDNIDFLTNKDGKTLTIVKKAGSYKLQTFQEYTLSTQKAWSNFYEGKESFKLDWNEADYTPFKGLSSYMADLIKTDHLFKWYPETYHKSLINKLVIYLDEKVNEKQILVSHGSDNALRLIIQSLTKPENVFLTLSPTYDNFRAQAETFGLIHKTTPIVDNSEKSLNDVLNSIINIQPRILYISNPNNPIGYQFSKNQLKEILGKCDEYNSILIIDEAYFEFSQVSAIDLINETTNLLIIRTFSKAFGLAGVRLGYLISNENIIRTVGLCSNPKDVTMFASKSAEYALEHKEEMIDYINEVGKNKNRFYRFCEVNKIEYYKSNGNFVSFKVDDVDKFLDYFDKNKIYIRDRRNYFNDNIVRITIGTNKTYNNFENQLIKYIKN